MTWTATRADLKAHGLDSSAWSPDARAVDAVHIAANSFELRSHGYSGGERVRHVVLPGGALPAGIVATMWRTVAATTDPDFYSLTGSALTTAGTGEILVMEDPYPKIDAILLARTSYVIASAIAYAGPWVTPPDWAPAIVAHLAAQDIVRVLRIPSARYPADDVRKAYEAAEKFCEMLRGGAPMADGKGPVDATSTSDDTARAGNAGGPAVVWTTGYL